MRRPTVFGDANPCFGTFEESLSIGLFSVGLLAIMAGEERVRVRTLSRFHGGWRRGEVLEEGSLTVLVANVVALVDDAAFHFAGGVAVREVAILFVAELEDVPEVRSPVGVSHFVNDAGVLTDSVFVPTAFLTCPS
jgi:hypothetical protein